jgi:hypothetical protein
MTWICQKEILASERKTYQSFLGEMSSFKDDMKVNSRAPSNFICTGELRDYDVWK